ncbi:MAG: helix-turn-helix transcriptional regulator [Tahibacter sp.]
MAKPRSAKQIFCTRLKGARRRAGMSQKELGIASGLDRFVASTRINRYEVGVHDPDMETVGRLARTLGVPVAYLFAEDDRQARLLLAFAALSKAEQEEVVAAIEAASTTGRIEG